MSKKISSIHYSTDWPSDLKDRNSSQWNKGIEIIKDRFESRYFKPLHSLIISDDKNIRYNVGFLIMSIDCLIIETLNQFYLGLTDSEQLYTNKNKDTNYQKNSQAFRDFFLHSKNFTEFRNNTDLTYKFYKDIRCGLLHQAESKVESLINLKHNVMVKLVNPMDVAEGLIINRNLFHIALVSDFNQYLADLEDPDSKNILGGYLRDACNEKMAKML